MDQLRVQQIAFLREQDGPIETELKKRLAAAFGAEMRIQAAYLVRVSYEGAAEQKVALCLKASPDDPADVARKVGEVFSQMFNRAESLDILLLSPKQEAEVAEVAKSFFTPST